ncbi:PspA/IM30 family protein [Bacillaceae bacterium S4-13-56]
MFKFFGRVKTIVNSELNSMLEKAEDPVKMLDQFMRDMAEDIQEAESAVAKQMASEKMLKRKYDDALEMVKKRQTHAEKAIEAGDEDLARRALEDKQNQQNQVDSLKVIYEQSHSDTENLRTKLDEMKREYHEMKIKKDSLKARAESAKTRTKMNRTMSSIGNDDSKRGFERMEEKVLQFEAEAETTEDLETSNRSLDDELKKLDDSGVEDELAALKKKLGKE